MRFTISFLFISLILSGGEGIFSQGTPGKKPKLYDTWISSKGGYAVPSGFLYEIRDSSVVVSVTNPLYANKPGAFSMSQIPASNIDVLKIRRTGSVKRGAIIGGIIVGVGAIAPLIPEIGDMDGFGIILFPLLATGGGAIGAGIGSLFGSMKNYFAIDRSVGNLNINRYQLEKYSYLNEYPAAPYQAYFGHRSYVGLKIGFALPIGDFADKSADNPGAGYALNDGGYVGFNLGLLLTDKFGVSLGFQGGGFGTENNKPDGSWEIVSIMAGPMYTIPVGSRFSVDIMARAGSVDAILFNGSEQVDEGHGLGFSFSSALRFNLSRRFCILAEPEFQTSRPKFSGDIKKNISNIGLGISAGYRFK